MADTQLDILVCPHCRQVLLTVLDPQSGLVCPHCRLVYPIRDDVPFLYDEEAIAAGAWLMGMRGLGEQTEEYDSGSHSAEVSR